MQSVDLDSSSKRVASLVPETPKKNEATFAPYKLTVIVNRAENLPIADFTTSDPYVIVSLGDKTIGRTKTIYKNHLSPEWDELYNVKLLHTKATLLFSVYDEDRGKDDDILGTVSIDLSKLALGVSVQNSYDVVNAVGYEKAKAKLHLTLILGRNDTVIEIVKANEEESIKVIQDDVFTQDDLEAVRRELALIKTNECVENELCSFAADGKTSFLTKGLVKDLLCDIHSMTTNIGDEECIYHSEEFNNNIELLYKRNQLKLVNASEFGFSTKSCIRHSPQMQNSLQLNFNAYNSHFIILQLPNRFSMWSWVRWLRLCYDVWSGETALADVPRWAANGSYTSSVPLTIILSHGQHSYSGKCTVAFKHPFELRVNDDIIKIKPLVNMLISHDSAVPKAYLVDIQVISYEVHGTHVSDVVTNSAHVPAELIDEDEEELLPERHAESHEHHHIGGGKLLFSFGKGVKGAVKGAVKGITYVGKGTVNVGSTVAVGAKDVVVGTVVGATGVAVHTTRTIASGNVMNMKTGISDAVVGVGKGLETVANTVTNVPTQMFGRTNSFLVLKSSLVTQKFTRHNIESLKFYLDVNEENLESRSSRAIEDNLENERDLIRRRSTMKSILDVSENRLHFPLFDQSNTCIDILLFQGVEGQESVVGAKHIPIRKLLNKTKKSIGSIRSSLLTALKLGETKVPLETELTLDSNLGLSITLIKGEGLVIPTSTIGNIAGEVGNMYAKCKLVDEMGHSGTSSAFGSRSQSIHASTNPNWNECNFILKANEQHYVSCEYVRVELYVEYLVSTGAESIGAIFIPFDYFQAKSREYTFPIVKYARATTSPVALFSALANVAAGTSTVIPSQQGLGTLTVRINRIDEDSNSKCKVRLKSSLVECSLFNSLWYGECMLAGNLEADSIEKYLEKYMVTASFDGLVLIDNNDAVEKVDTRHRGHSHSGKDTDASHHAKSHLKSAVFGGASSTTPPVTPHSGPSSAPGSGKFDSKKTGYGGVADRSTSVIDHSMMEMVVEVYQNQRRQLLPPFDWSTSAITRPDYSDLSYQIPYKFTTLNAAKPPVGFEFVGEWEIDKKYCNCDENGWAYSISFGRLLANQKAGKTYNKPQNTHVRRRKWVRTARMIVEEPESQMDSRFSINQRYVSNGESSRPTESWMRPTFDAHSFARGNDTDHSNIPTSSTGGDKESGAHGERPSSVARGSTAAATAALGHNWRKDAFLAAANSNTVNNIVALCQERASEDDHVTIKWSSIYSATVVTPSILSIHFTVMRYFGEENSQTYSPRFQPVDIELFVSNCNALELKGLIDERIWFYQYRTDIKNLILNTEEMMPSHSMKSDNDDDATVDCHDVPETEELSIGSEIVADLDDTSIALESKIRQLDQLYAKTRDHTLMQEKAVIVRRDCRLRLYLAALLGAGLNSNHSYDVADVHKIMESDFKKMLKINQDNDVSTANNRIEYLLDTAEKRIRDTALCGWNHRGGQLEQCLEVFTNGYFIEIVGLLGRFFDGTGQVVKGLHSKVELITTYMKHNDRLDFIIESALRPYKLKASPAPKLSIFLDFEVLASWYTSVLLFEMRGRVDDVLNVWKDPAKDVSGMSSCYKFHLPWIPQRLDAGGIFLTAIPEDLVEILMTYLSHARLKKSNVAASFHESIGRLDGTVCLSFASSFLYLSEEYQNAMLTKEYGNMGEEELSEYFTWVSSIANDARRVRRIEILSAVESKDASTFEVHAETQKKVTELVTNTYFAYDKVMMKALDHISCILMMYLFHDTLNYLDKDFYVLWKANVDKLTAEAEKRKIAGTQSKSVDANEDQPAATSEEEKDEDQLVPNMMLEFSDYLEDKMDYIEPFCFYKLVAICADKFIIFYMTFLREARLAGELFANTSTYTAQIAKDIQSIKDCFGLIAGHPSISQYYSEIMDKFIILDHCYVLLSCVLMSAECDAALEALIQIAKDHNSRDFSIAMLIETCMGLRGLKKFVVTKPSAAGGKRAVSTAGSSPMVSKHGGPSTPSTGTGSSASPSPAKRGSIFSFLHLGGHTEQHPQPQPQAHHPPVPTMTFDIDTELPDDQCDPEDDLDEESELFRESKRLQEESFTTFIEERITYIHSLHANHNKAFKKTASDTLIYIPPECRVFDTESDCSRYSLKAQLLQSAIPAAKRDLTNAKAVRNSVTSKSLFSGLSGLFGSKATAAADPRKSAHSVVPAHVHHHGRRASIEGKLAPSTPSDGTSRAPAPINLADAVKTVAFQMLITNIQFNHLFYLDFASLKPYLVIKLGEYSYKTAVREGDNNPSWKLECPIELPVYNTAKSAEEDQLAGEDNSLNELVISLFYQGFFNDHYIGSIIIPFPNFAPLKFDEKHFILTDFSQSQRAAQAAARATSEGRSLPTLSISIV